MKRKKSNKFQLLISSAALLLILLVAAGVTYSWIEGGTTYSIKTENSNVVKTGTAPVMPIANSLKITPGSTDTVVNLNDFDKTTNNTQGLYFSEVSSSDGENFYFPFVYNEDGTAKAYRAANTNDIGTKFIKYDFNVTATKTCYLAFDQTPTITATKDGSEISDTSAFRIMLRCGMEKHILTTAGSDTSDSDRTSNAVTNIDGSTTALTAEPVEKYVYRHDDSVQMFKFNQNETKTIEVSVWLDAEKASSELIGAKVNLNMNLKVDQALVKTKVYVESRGYATHYGYVYTDNNKTEFDKWPGKLMTFVSNTGYYCVEGALSENAYFIVNNGLNNYQEGAAQYPPKDSDILKDLVIDISDEKDVNGYITYVLKKDGTWHRFDDTEITVNAHSAAFDNDGTTPQTPDASMGTVSIDGSTGAVSASKVVYQDTAAGTDVTLTASAGANYEFAGWYSDSDCSDESLITKESTYKYNANKTDKINKDLYAKFVEKPKYTVTFDAVTYDNNNNKLKNGFTGGKIDSNTASYDVTKYRDEKVEATATANTNYTFEGWYTDPDCADRVETANKLSKTVDSSCDGVTYYAKFVEKPKHTVAVYAKTYPTGKFADGDGGTVTVNDSPSSVEVYEGSTVTINATANTAENFRFEGWYTDSNCTTKLDGANYSQAEKTVTVGKEDPQNYYAKFVKQYKVTFKSVLANGTESSDCATLKINNETVSSKIVDFNTEVTLSAEAKGTYVFKKIYKIVDGLKVEVSKTSPTTVTINDDITYFAEFDSKPPVTTTIYFEPRKDFNISKAYVFNLSSKRPYIADWPGDDVSYDNELGLYVYSFKTTDEGQFGVVVNNNGSSEIKQYPGNNYQLVGEIGGTYIFRNEKYTYTFDKNNNASLETIKIVNVSVTPKTYPGDLEAAAGGTAKASVSKGYSGKEITLTATPNTGFRFAGWYTNKDCTDEYKVSDTDNEKTSLKVTLGDTDVTYFAKFVKQVTVELKVRTDGVDSSAGGKVSINGGTSFSTSANATVDIGDSTSILPATMFAAQANNGYQFESWYDENNKKIVLPNAIEVTEDTTYYANFVTLHSVTLKVKTDGTVGGEGGQVSVDGGTNYDSTSASIDVVTGGTFTPSEIFAQKANDGYEFEGWYDSNNNKINSLPDTPVIVSSSMIYYANFKTKESTVNCYLMGDVNVNESGDNKWNVGVNSDSKIMTDNGDGIYSRTVTLSANSPYEFKVIEKDSKNSTWYGTDGGTVDIDDTYTDFNKTSGNNAIMTTTSAGDYIFTYNQKEHKIKIKAPESTKVDLPTEDLPTTSKISSNTLIFNFGSSNPISKIWYWDDSNSGKVKDTTNYSNGTSTVSTYSFSSGVENPKAIAFKSTLTASDGSTIFPNNDYKLTGDITNNNKKVETGPYYVSSTSATEWSSFTHLTPRLTVSATNVNVNSSVTLSASVSGTFNSNTKYTFYVQKDGVTYRASDSKTTSNTCTWTPNVSGTYTVYVAAYDEFGIETVVSNPETVTVN